VISPLEGTPAFKLGIRAADRIVAIDSKDVPPTVNNNDVCKQLRGPEGSIVHVSIERENVDHRLEFDIARARIPQESVPYAFMIRPGVGYIRITRFASATGDELEAKLEQLKAAGMKELLLDLRFNSGGLLNQAVEVSDRFLNSGQKIVYTRGRGPNANQDYRATEDSEYTHLPIVTLVNRDSASASEIVSGALQDHDRALIVGETTFGKALVQSVYPISDGAGVAVTTGRYYTPSGRLIQRPWDAAFDEYLTYTLREQTPERAHKASDLKYTDSGRKVYSGGGVEPDKYVVGASYEGFNPTRFGRLLFARQEFANFADQYVAEGDTRFSAANKNKKPIARGFAVTDAMLREFREFLGTRKVKIDEDSFAKDETFIRAMIHFEIDSTLFGMDEARKNLIAKDPQAQFALGQFGEAENLLTLASTRNARKGQ